MRLLDRGVAVPAPGRQGRRQRGVDGRPRLPPDGAHLGPHGARSGRLLARGQNGTAPACLANIWSTLTNFEDFDL